MLASGRMGSGRGESLRRPTVLGWMRLARAYRRLDGASARLFRRYGLGVGQFDVLARVGAGEGITQQALADSLLVTKGNVAQLLGRMERGGLLVRRAEGRANRIHLTDEGRRLFAEVVPAQEAHIHAKLAGALTPEEQRLFFDLLRKLDRALEREER